MNSDLHPALPALLISLSLAAPTMAPAPPIDALQFLSARKRALVADAPPELREVFAWLLVAKRQSTFRPRSPACRMCSRRSWPCIDPVHPGKQRRCEGCYRSGSRCVMPHPGEVAPTPARSILQTHGGESDEDIMDVDDEVEEEANEIQGGQEAMAVDAEAEQFFMAANEHGSGSDSDSEIEFVSMTGPGPAHWIRPSRAAPQASSSARPRTQATVRVTTTAAPASAPTPQTSHPTPPPTPPPPRPSPHQLQNLRWTDTDVEAILAAASRHADPTSVLLYNCEVKSLRGKTLLVVVVPAQDGMPWHVGVCERTAKQARLICAGGGDSSAMTDHVVALFRAMGCRIDDFGVLALGPLAVPGAVWASVVAVWLTRKGRRPLPQLRQLDIREEYVLRDMNCLLRVGYWQSQCTIFRPAPVPAQVQDPDVQAPVAAAAAPAAASPSHLRLTEPDAKPESVIDDSDSDASEPDAERASYHGIDFSEEGVGKILTAAAATAAAKCLVIYGDEKKFLRGAEQVTLVFPPRDGLPWHIGVCDRLSQKTRLVCVERSGDTGAMLAHVKKRFLAFPSLRCDMSDLAAVQLPRKLSKLPGGGWAAVVAVWLSRGNSLDKLNDHPRIRKKLMRKDLNLILDGKQWADKCVRTGRKEGRYTRAQEKAKDAVKEEAERERPLRRRGRRLARERARAREQEAAANSEERYLNGEPGETAPVFRTHDTQPVTIHI